MKKLLIIPILLSLSGQLLAEELHANQSDKEVVRAELHQTSVPLEPCELSELENLSKNAEDLHDLSGGADKKFWKAAAIGGLAVLLIIAIF